MENNNNQNQVNRTVTQTQQKNAENLANLLANRPVLSTPQTPKGNVHQASLMLKRTSETLHVSVRDKNGIILEQDVFGLTSYNDLGVFDVLPEHENFISLINHKLLIRSDFNDSADKEIAVGTGLIKVLHDKVDIYVGLPDIQENSTQTIEQNFAAIKK